MKLTSLHEEVVSVESEEPNKQRMHPMGMFTRKIAIAAASPIILLGGMALATTTASAATAHVVTPGETLSGIALQNGTTVSNLVSLNNIVNPDLINVGQVLQVDGSHAVTHTAVHPAVYYHKATQKSAPVAQQVESSNTSSGGSSDLNWIIQHESGGSTTAVNPSSGTYGLAQWLPGTGPGAGTSYSTQYAAAEQYAQSRYGSDANAKAFWEAHSWW